MRKYLTCLAVIVLAKAGFSQEAVPPPPPIPEEPVLTIVDEKADFPGGPEALKKFLSENLRYPESAAAANISGKCYVKFIVSKTGEISEVILAKKVSNCPDCDKEAVRLVKSMPKWTPGKVKGKAVHSYFNLPVEFKPR